MPTRILCRFLLFFQYYPLKVGAAEDRKKHLNDVKIAERQWKKTPIVERIGKLAYKHISGITAVISQSV
jgi:hypothetical protein